MEFFIMFAIVFAIIVMVLVVCSRRKRGQTQPTLRAYEEWTKYPNGRNDYWPHPPRRGSSSPRSRSTHPHVDYERQHP
jgi:hypothetical protein